MVEITMGQGIVSTKSLGMESSKFNVQLLPGPRAGGKRRLEIFSPGASGDIASLNGVGHVQVVRTTSSQTQTTRAKITEASASLRVTGALGWARTCQNEETNVLFDKEA